MHFVTKRNGVSAPMAALAVAFWPVWRWYAERLRDGSDEPYGLLALGALALLWRPGRPASLAPALVLLGVYVLTWSVLPPLARALLAVATLGSLTPRAAGQSGLWGLLALSLPVTASLQFYLGYPLRLAAAITTAAVFRLGGCPVGRAGALLTWRGESVLVDAPCSGVHLLWFGLALACGAAAFFRLPPRRTVLCLGAAAAAVIAANLLRATLLFPREVHLVRWPAWTHPGAGVLCFAAAAWGILRLARYLQTRPCSAPSSSPSAS